MKNTKKIKVLHICSRMDCGGAESRLMDLWRFVDKSEMEFHFLVYSREKQYYEDEILELGGKIIYAENPGKVGFFRSMKSIVRAIKENGPYTVVHAHTATNAGTALIAARLAGIRNRLFHARDTYEPINGNLCKLMYVKLMRASIRINATQYLSVGLKAACSYFGERACKKGKVTIIPNAIDIDKYKQSLSIKTIKEVRQELSISEDALVIGHVGSFRTEKNHSYIIRLFNILLQLNKNSKLVLVGGGQNRTIYEQMAKDMGMSDNIIFLGIRSDIPRILSAFDIILFPSIREGIPGAVLEAQAAGIPCVLSDTIDRTVDMDIGLLQFLPLDAGDDVWIQYLKSIKNKRIFDSEVIRKAFYRKSYNLKAESELLKEIYLYGRG